MLATIAILPAILRFCICLATAWIVKNVPTRGADELHKHEKKTENYMMRTGNININDSPKVLRRIIQRSRHLLYPRRCKQPIHLLGGLLINSLHSRIHHLGIGDIQLQIRNLPSVPYRNLLGRCPFFRVWLREEITAVDVGAAGFEEGRGDAETETAGAACDDDGPPGEGEEVDCGDVGKSWEERGGRVRDRTWVCLGWWELTRGVTRAGDNGICDGLSFLQRGCRHDGFEE